ncbi:hypothetical protein PRIC1_004721 [Phytophthora ramorum]
MNTSMALPLHLLVLNIHSHICSSVGRALPQPGREHIAEQRAVHACGGRISRRREPHVLFTVDVEPRHARQLRVRVQDLRQVAVELAGIQQRRERVTRDAQPHELIKLALCAICVAVDEEPLALGGLFYESVNQSGGCRCARLALCNCGVREAEIHVAAAIVVDERTCRRLVLREDADVAVRQHLELGRLLLDLPHLGYAS